MNVSLTPQLEKIVRDKVESGLYNNASEVVREAIRRMRRNEASEHHAMLGAALDEGIAAADRGEKVELTDKLWDRIMAEGDALAASGAPLDPLVTGEHWKFSSV